MKAKRKTKLDKLTRKSIRKMVESQLMQALQVWRRDLGEAEYISRIKKASKLITKDISRSPGMDPEAAV